MTRPRGARNRYTTDPGLVLDELRARAGKRTDILAQVAGAWVGYYGDPYTPTLADALATIDGAEEWVEVCGRRRSATPQKTP